MMRVAAFQQVGGFNSTLIAGEEPELCVRIRQNGWKILRLDAEMTRHDAQMRRFGQWWKRMLRGGHAFAEGAWLHGQTPERHWVKESRSIWIWGLLVPLLALGLALPTKGLSLLLLGGYLLMAYRINRYMQQQGLPAKEAWLYGLFCMLAKFPQLQGQLQFHLNRLLGRRNVLVEYKKATPVNTAS